MTDDDAMHRAGWEIFPDDGFIDLVGPLWHRLVDGGWHYAIVGQEKHRNRRGVVQGGLLMTFADRASGMAAREASGAAALATVQMDVHFIDAAQIGEVITTPPRVIRATKSLIFTVAEVRVGARVVAHATGVFKVMRG